MAMTSNGMHRNIRPSLSSFPAQSSCFPSTHHLSVIHFNARSLLPKIPELRLLSRSLSPHVIAVTESWLTPSVPNGALHVHGYDTVLRNDRSDDRRGGGVLLMIRNDLSRCKERPDLRTWPESVWSEIRIGSKILILGCLYRPPTSDSSIFAEALEDAIDNINHQHKILLVGDFNATSPAWCASDSYNEAGRLLEPLFYSLGLHQSLSSPTHLRADGSLGSLLDLVVTNDPNLISDVSTHPPIGSSDHLVVECATNLRKEGTPQQTSPSLARRIWCYDKADCSALNKHLLSLDWPDVLTASDIDSAWIAWKSSFLSTVKKYIPSKVIKKVKPKNPVVTKDIENVIKEKRKAYRTYKRNPTNDNREAFNSVRNRVTHLIRKASRAHTSTLHRRLRLDPSPSASSDFWQHIKAITGKTKKTIIPDLITQDQTATDARAKANLLNNFFAEQTKLPDADIQIPDADSLPFNEECFSSIFTTPSEVYDILQSLKVNKAAGPDGLTPRLLRLCSSGIATSLAILFNRSYAEGCFPDDWKHALVIPIFKKGDRHTLGNYRPISLLSVVSKVMERVVYNKLYKFLAPVLSANQSGFKKKDGTALQLLRLTQEWSEAVDRSQYVGVVFLDLKKAFDRVWHKGLLVKLERAGVRGQALKWFLSFLSNRRQSTLVEDMVSSFASVHAGVPQGAILSPLLFSLYLNDMCSSAQGKVNLFADDTSLYVTSRSIQSLCSSLQSAVNSTSAWFEKWLLTVNSGKSAVLVLRSTKMTPIVATIYVGGNVLQQATSHRHLGLVFNETLTWTNHVDHIVKKSSQRLGLLHRLRGQLSGAITRDLFFTCVRPLIEYASIAWSGMFNHDVTRLNRVNRRAARLISGISRSENIPGDIVLARAGLQPLHQRRRLAQTLFVYKVQNDLLPDHLKLNLSHWFVSEKPEPSRYPSRRGHTLELPRANKSVLQRSPFYSAFSLWNTLPDHLRSKPSPKLLKDFFSS